MQFRRLVVLAVLVAASVVLVAPSANAATAVRAATAPTIEWGYGNDMHPGDGENLFLTGFDFSQPVTIHFFDRTFTTTYYPSARFTLYSPADAGFGTETIWAKQGTRYAQYDVNVTEWTPTANASATSATVGQRITFDGDGFASNDTVALFVNGRDQDRNATAGSSVNYFYTQGQLRGVFGYTVPEKFRGKTVTFTLKSELTGALANVTVNVAP